MTYLWILLGVVVTIGMPVLIYSLLRMAAPTPEERLLEDEEQAKFIREWNESHK